MSLEEFENCAPVLIPTLNRLQHLRCCIESLKKNKLAEKTDLIISLDYPPSPKYEEGYYEVRDYLDAGIDGFKSVTVFKQDHNLGAFGNYGNGAFLLSYARKQYDRYIYAEDDVEFAPNFLEYINKGLDIFENEDDIIAICGDRYVKEPEGISDNIILATNFSAYGYGTWFKKWDKISENINRNNFEKLARNRIFVKELYRLDKAFFYALQSIITRSQKLYQTIDGEVPVIDTSLCIYMFATKKYVVAPVTSVSITNGCDGSGENCIAIQDNEKKTLDNRESFEYVFSTPLKIYQQENMLNWESHIRYFVGKMKIYRYLQANKTK